MAKTNITYSYQARPDYNKTVTVNGKKLRCYSKDKLPKLFPRGGYSFVGEIFTGNTSDTAGVLEVQKEKIPMSVVRSRREKGWSDVGYIRVGENQFVAVIKKTGFSTALWLSLIALILIAATVTTVVVVRRSREDPVDPSSLDPHIVPITTDLVTLSGTVTSAGVKAEGAVVILYAGSTELSRTSTDAEGKYLFSQIGDGAYNVSVSYNGMSAWKAVFINKLSVVQDFVLTASGVSSKVEITGTTTPRIAVSGLDAEAQAHAVEGKRVSLTLQIERLDAADVPAADKTLITAKSGDTALTYFRFSLLREIFSAGGVSEGSTVLTETSSPLEIIIPYDSSRDVGTYVFRVHEGAADKFTELSSRPTGTFTDGTYYVSADYVFIYASKFSTFSIGSASAGQVTKGQDVITYSDKAYINLTTGKVEMLYCHDGDSSNNVRLEIYIQGTLISSSGIIPPGNELRHMTLSDGMEKWIPVGTYEGVLRVNYLDTEGQTATNVEIPLQLAASK